MRIMIMATGLVMLAGCAGWSDRADANYDCAQAGISIGNPARQQCVANGIRTREAQREAQAGTTTTMDPVLIGVGAKLLSPTQNGTVTNCQIVAPGQMQCIGP
jgi:hypothetical protein